MIKCIMEGYISFSTQDIIRKAVDEKDQANREKQEEQELGDAGRGRSDSSESEKRRD